MKHIIKLEFKKRLKLKLNVSKPYATLSLNTFEFMVEKLKQNNI